MGPCRIRSTRNFTPGPVARIIRSPASGRGGDRPSMRPSFVAVVVFALPLIARAQVPVPTVDGPITGPGDPFLPATSFDLADVGYTQEEYFISGTATAYRNTAPLGLDGMWSVEPSGVTA